MATKEILGYASFSALSVANDLSYPAETPIPGSKLSLQLETVLQVQSGSTKYLYLIQNVPEIDTSVDAVSLVSNVYAWGTSAQAPGSTTCVQANSTITYQMEHMSGQAGSVLPESGSAEQRSPYFYASGAAIGSYELPFSIIVGTTIVGDHVSLFYDIPGSAPMVWDTLTFTEPDSSLSLIASPSAGGFGVGSAAFYIGGPGGGESAAFSAISGELGLYYRAGKRIVPFSDIENASSPNTTIPEGTENVAVGIGSDGFLTLTVGAPTALTDTQFKPPVPPALAAAAATELVSTLVLSGGAVGSSYSESLVAMDGVAPYRWSITNGGLPDGVTRHGSRLSGKPTTTGVFSITVAVEDSSKPPQAATRSLNITIGTFPTISIFAPTVTGGSVSINGVALPTTPGASVTQILWTWGDGTSSISTFPAGHTYTSSGNYTVMATATDSNGLTASASESVAVTVDTPPTISLFTPTVTGASVSINGVSLPTTPGASVNQILWTWGDGTSSISTFPDSHTYTSSGTHPVTATATDSNGLTASASESVNVT